jgi:hypothetical protein
MTIARIVFKISGKIGEVATTIKKAFSGPRRMLCREVERLACGFFTRQLKNKILKAGASQWARTEGKDGDLREQNNK